MRHQASRPSTPAVGSNTKLKTEGDDKAVKDEGKKEEGGGATGGDEDEINSDLDDPEDDLDDDDEEAGGDGGDLVIALYEKVGSSALASTLCEALTRREFLGTTRQEQVEGDAQGWSRLGQRQGLLVQQVLRVRRFATSSRSSQLGADDSIPLCSCSEFEW